MTPQYTDQFAAGLLMSGFISLLAIGLFAGLLAVLYFRNRRARPSGARKPDPCAVLIRQYQPSIFDHPCRWLAIKGSAMTSVQSALGLHNPVPCSWGEGMSQLSTRNLFVSPPIRGWIIVVGEGLPDPGDDVDRCFHFLVRLSRSLGEIQFFSVNRAVNHHAWVKAEHGAIQRAYAWAGETVWNQGEPTQAEIDLTVRIIPYGESAGPVDFSAGDVSLPNSEKVLPLAARWSFDPTTVNEAMLSAEVGIAGDLTRSSSG